MNYGRHERHMLQMMLRAAYDVQRCACARTAIEEGERHVNAYFIGATYPARFICAMISGVSLRRSFLIYRARQPKAMIYASGKDSGRRAFR